MGRPEKFNNPERAAEPTKSYNPVEDHESDEKTEFEPTNVVKKEAKKFEEEEDFSNDDDDDDTIPDEIDKTRIGYRGYDYPTSWKKPLWDEDQFDEYEEHFKPKPFYSDDDYEDYYKKSADTDSDSDSYGYNVPESVKYGPVAHPTHFKVFGKHKRYFKPVEGYETPEINYHSDFDTSEPTMSHRPKGVKGMRRLMKNKRDSIKKKKNKKRAKKVNADDVTPKSGSNAD